jgi:hypothetical protein
VHAIMNPLTQSREESRSTPEAAGGDLTRTTGRAGGDPAAGRSCVERVVLDEAGAAEAMREHLSGVERLVLGPDAVRRTSRPPSIV